MDIELMSLSMEKFLQEANKLQWKKNADYHPDKVAMLEVLQTAWETGVTVEQDLWGRVRKQLSALRRFVIEGHVESEPPQSRMIDVAVYMAMMNFWVENREVCLRDALWFVTNKRSCETVVSGLLPLNDTSCCDRCAFLLWLQSYVDKTTAS